MQDAHSPGTPQPSPVADMEMEIIDWPYRQLLTVYMCLEKLFYKIFFFVILIWFCYGFVMVSLWLILCFFACPQNSYDFDMVLLWSWSASFFLMKFVMAGRIFFVKKYLVMFWTFQNGKNINYLYLENKKIWIKSKKCFSC